MQNKMYLNIIFVSAPKHAKTRSRDSAVSVTHLVLVRGCF
jgi:hypothetical protein